MTKQKTTIDPTSRFRVSVKRSNRYITAQIIDDSKGITLVSVNPKEISKAKTKTEQADLAASILAKKAKEAKISKVHFDRRDARYHGRVKTFAEQLRKSGLEF